MTKLVNSLCVVCASAAIVVCGHLCGRAVAACGDQVECKEAGCFFSASGGGFQCIQFLNAQAASNVFNAVGNEGVKDCDGHGTNLLMVRASCNTDCSAYSYSISSGCSGEISDSFNVNQCICE